jgi:hypothetical protein
MTVDRVNLYDKYLFMFRPKFYFACSLFFILVGALPCRSQTISDASFEFYNVPDNSFRYASFINANNPTSTPWTFAGNAGVIDANGGGFGTGPAADGEQFAFLQYYSSPGEFFGGGAFSQAITFTLAGTYRLTYQEAGRVFSDPSGGNLPYQVLLDGNAIDNGTLLTSTGEAFTTRTLDFSVLSGGLHTLTFATRGTPSGDNTGFFDGVSIQAVPEPASGGVFMAAGAVFCAYRQYRKKKRA